MVALVSGTIAAMAVTQHYRREGTVISAVSVKPKKCPRNERGHGIKVSFYLPRDDTLDVAIVKRPDGPAIRSLATARRLSGGRRHCFPWDARDQAGARVPAGKYRLRVSLSGADRVATAGERIRVRAKGGP